MVEIPTAVFYTTAIALCVVCAFLAILLFYAIKLAQIIIRLLRHVEEGGAYVKMRLYMIQKIFRIIVGIFKK